MTSANLADEVPLREPYRYRRRELQEPDWRRFRGWTKVTEAEWGDAQWQRTHCVKNVHELLAVMGPLLDDTFVEDLVADQRDLATMSMLLTPQIINTMVPDDQCARPGLFSEALRADPVRRYMLPIRSDRDPIWPSHPLATRDSLHEAEMWVVEGLVHRYPTKVLAELLSTCPQYCGHCTRMDLVGNSTPQVEKLRLRVKRSDRYQAMLEYLREHREVRDIVLSGGDVANLPWPQLEHFVTELLSIDSIRDIRLASKALAGLPQHWLQPAVREGLARLAQRANRQGVNLAVHTHVNHAHSVTPLVAEATRAVFDAGVRDVRNQGVLMRGVNATARELLDLCFALQGEANILPYYFYMCDMIPNAEHWRVAVWEAQDLQHSMMGLLPGYATPRIVCDVPYVGKRWVDQVADYDRLRGVTLWRESSSTAPDLARTGGLEPNCAYYDPISTLPPRGAELWHHYAAAARAVN